MFLTLSPVVLLSPRAFHLSNTQNLVDPGRSERVPLRGTNWQVSYANVPDVVGRDVFVSEIPWYLGSTPIVNLCGIARRM